MELDCGRGTDDLGVRPGGDVMVVADAREALCVVLEPALTVGGRPGVRLPL